MNENEKFDEEKMQNQFQLSEELQCEFGGDFGAFVAFSRADLAGRVRLCTPKSCMMMSVADFHNSQELTRLTEEIEKKSAALKRAKEIQDKSAQADYERGTPCES